MTTTIGKTQFFNAKSNLVNSEKYTIPSNPVDDSRSITLSSTSVDVVNHAAKNGSCSILIEFMEKDVFIWSKSIDSLENRTFELEEKLTVNDFFSSGIPKHYPCLKHMCWVGEILKANHGRTMAEELEMQIQYEAIDLYMVPNGTSGSGDPIARKTFNNVSCVHPQLDEMESYMEGKWTPYRSMGFTKYSQLKVNLEILRKKDFSKIGWWFDTTTFRLYSTSVILGASYRAFMAEVSRLELDAFAPDVMTTESGIEITWGPFCLED